MVKEAEEKLTSDYLVVQTRTLRVVGTSAAEARKTAELIFQLAPNKEAVTTTVKVERIKD